MQTSKTVFSQRCVKCSREYNMKSHMTLCDCGGLIDFEYDLDSLENWDWVDKELPGILRYSKLLPIMDPTNGISLGVENPKPTPLYKSSRLGEFLGLKHLWLKDETKNFTRTFKTRDAVVSVSRFREIGVNEFVICSTGNTIGAFCYAISRAKLPMVAHMFLPKTMMIDFEIQNNLIPYVQLVDGPYQKVMERAKRYSEETGFPFEGGFSNPARREGSKTLGFEVAEAGLEPEWYVQGVASGTGVCGFSKSFSELRKIGVSESVPKILSVLPDGCAPIVNAFNTGASFFTPNFIVRNPRTSVTTLANGDPSFSYPYVRQTVLESDGHMEKYQNRKYEWHLTC